MNDRGILTLRDLARDHSAWLDKARNYDEDTRRAYRAAYNTYAEWVEYELGFDCDCPEREYLAGCAHGATPEHITYENLEAYFIEYVTANAPASYNHRRQHWIVIVAWLMSKGHMTWGPNFAEDIPVRKHDPRTPRERFLSDEEFLALLATARRSHVREYYLCLFLRFSPRRIGEAVNLRWADIRWDEGDYYYDNSKARRHGEVAALTPAVRAILEEWRQVYCSELGVSDVRSSWYVFPSLNAGGPIRKGRKRQRTLAPETIFANTNFVIREYLLKPAGLYLGKGDGWHILRKTTVNQIRQDSKRRGRADSWDLAAKAAGHQNTTTTKIYVNEDEEYETYKAYAQDAQLMSPEAMAKIPVLAALSTPETTKEPAPAEADAGEAQEVYAEGQSLANVISLTSRRRAAALG